MMTFPTYKDAKALTPSDTLDLATPASALYVGQAGTLKVNMAGSVPGGGETVAFAAVSVGLLEIAVTRVWNTGTSAASIVALR
jgi:hypothetical protein